MPLYEYYCADCQGKFELLVSYETSAADDIVCARCHGPHVRKLLSVVARPRGGADDFSASDEDYGASDEDYGDDFGGGCACGGACSCQD